MGCPICSGVVFAEERLCGVQRYQCFNCARLFIIVDGKLKLYVQRVEEKEEEVGIVEEEL